MPEFRVKVATLALVVTAVESAIGMQAKFHDTGVYTFQVDKWVYVKVYMGDRGSVVVSMWHESCARSLPVGLASLAELKTYVDIDTRLKEVASCFIAEGVKYYGLNLTIF